MLITREFEVFPIIAILRGVDPQEVEAIGQVLYDNGVRCIEVPLNSPSPFESVAILAKSLPKDCLIGAGTVLTADDVTKVRAAGGRLIVTPNLNVDVVRTALDFGLEIAPGIATPTEAFAAVSCGARNLKLFPASTLGPDHLKAMLAVLPKDIKVLAVGGIGSEDFEEWQNAGAAGFGIGSELYTAGDSAENVLGKITGMRSAMGLLAD